MCFTYKRKMNCIQKEDCVPDRVQPPGWVGYNGTSHHNYEFIKFIKTLLLTLNICINIFLNFIHFLNSK